MNGDHPLAPPPKRAAIGEILKGARPEIRQLLTVAHEQDFQVVPTRNNHYMIMTPEHYTEKNSCFAPKTPSDRRGAHRVKAKLRKIGVRFPH